MSFQALPSDVRPAATRFFLPQISSLAQPIYLPNTQIEVCRRLLARRMKIEFLGKSGYAEPVVVICREPSKLESRATSGAPGTCGQLTFRL